MQSHIDYLKDVLGVESWIRCESKVAPMVVAIRVKPNWGETEKNLVEKILSSVSLSGFPKSNQPVAARNLIQFDSDSPIEIVAKFGHVEWNLGPLRALLSGSAA